MGHQLYPQQPQPAAGSRLRLHGRSLAARAGLPQGTGAGRGTLGLSTAPGVTPAPSSPGRRGQKPREGEKMARTDTIGHKDFVFFLHVCRGKS